MVIPKRREVPSHAELTIHATKKGLPRDYADRFFRRASRTANAATPTEPEPTPTK
ncbi:MAG: hypothetical protein U0183_13235 [Polyangiaceae bacterium]